MKIEMVPIERVIPYARNPRVNTEKAISAVAGSLKQFGFRQPIVVDHEMVIVVGHTRLLAAQRLGMKEVPVHVAEGLTAEEIKAYRITDNKVAEFSEWDEGLLKLEMVDLQNAGYPLLETGFEMHEIDTKLNAGETKPEGFEDEVPEPPVVPASQRGDMFILGNHKLYCGDSATPEAFEAIMGGIKAQLVVTDPPWNVSYGKNLAANNAMNYKPRTIMNDEMTPEKWQEFLQACISNIFNYALPGCPIYCVMGASEWPAIDKALRENGFHWSCTIIWVKDHGVLSRKDYNTQYEPFWYGWKEGAARLQEIQDHTQTDVWMCDRPRSSPLHPTTKPVELIERPIKNSSKSGDIVLEPFGGSGTTLIACEMHGRCCRAIELDPQYVDTILNRWAQFTGRDPIRESDGKAWSQIVDEHAAKPSPGTI